MKSIASNADMGAASRRSAIHDAETCSKLDTLSSQMIAWHEAQLRKVDAAVQDAKRPPEPAIDEEQVPVEPPKPKTKVISRSAVLPTKALKSEEDVNAYVEEFRSRLLAELEGNDSIRLGQ